jgi:hypothetical protein
LKPPCRSDPLAQDPQRLRGLTGSCPSDEIEKLLPGGPELGLASAGILGDIDDVLCGLCEHDAIQYSDPTGRRSRKKAGRHANLRQRSLGCGHRVLKQDRPLPSGGRSFRRT